MEHGKGTNKRPWSGQELATHLGIGHRQVDRYVELGMPKMARNKFDPDGSCLWAREYELKTKERPKAAGNLTDEETRLKSAQADLRELEFQVKTGKLITSETAVMVFVHAIASAKTRLMSIPSKLAVPVLSCQGPNEAKALIESEIIQALNELSDVALPQPQGAETTPGGDTERLDSSETQAIERVGRRKQVHPGQRKPHGARKVANVAG